MGTSSSSKGPLPRTPLIPTWSEPADNKPLPGSKEPTEVGGSPDDTKEEDRGGAQEPEPRKAIEPPVDPDRFRSARSNFTRSAKSGGSDTDSLKRGIGQYVRNGSGGNRGATQRMGSSRRAAAGVLSVLRSIQRDGTEATLHSLNLGELAGRSVEEIFTGLTDVICGSGGDINDSIASDAWIETIADLSQIGVTDLDSLTPEQMQEIFISFITHSIETRLYQDIGAKGIKVAADTQSIRSFERQLHGYIDGRVRDAVSSDLAAVKDMTDREIHSVVNQTYEEAWGLLDMLGDDAE